MRGDSCAKMRIFLPLLCFLPIHCAFEGTCRRKGKLPDQVFALTFSLFRGVSTAFPKQLSIRHLTSVQWKPIVSYSQRSLPFSWCVFSLAKHFFTPVFSPTSNFFTPVQFSNLDWCENHSRLQSQPEMIALCT